MLQHHCKKKKKRNTFIDRLSTKTFRWTSTRKIDQFWYFFWKKKCAWWRDKGRGGKTEGKREKERSSREVWQLESLRMAMTRDRGKPKRGRKGKKFNYKHRGGTRNTVLRERTRTRTMTRRRGRRSRPNSHGLAPGKTLSAKRRESVQRLSLGFKKLLITWISSSVPPR